MFVSVIIPAYNAEKTIFNCIRSCIKQKEYLKEIIVVDDFSTDKTWAEVTKFIDLYPDLIKLFLNLTKGGNNARNFGFEQASGQFIQWLDADDELGNNKLKHQVEFLIRDNTFQIAYCNWKIKTVYENGKFNEEIKEEQQCNDFLTKLLNDKWLPSHAYLIRYESALAIYNSNGWNPESAVLQDREYFTIAALLGFQFGYVENTQVTYYRYKFVDSVSKADNYSRCLALYKIMIRIKNSEFLEKKKHKNLEIYVDSLILISQLQINVKTQKYISPTKIKWKLFPGNRLRFKALLKLYLPFY